MLKISIGSSIGGMSKPSTKQTEFKPRGKKGSGSTSKKPLFDVSSIVKEASEHNKSYWKKEIQKIIKEFGFNFLSDGLKEMAKGLGIKQRRKQKQ